MDQNTKEVLLAIVPILGTLVGAIAYNFRRGRYRAKVRKSDNADKADN